MQLGLERETADQRRRYKADGRCEPAQHHAEQCERDGMRDGQPGETHWIHRTDRPRPANFVKQQFAQRSFGAHMCDNQRRNRHIQSGPPRRHAQPVIVGQLVGDRLQPTELRQSAAAPR